MQRNLGQKYGQLVTTPSDTTVNSSHDFTVWWIDWLPAFINAIVVAKGEKEEQKNVGVTMNITEVVDEICNAIAINNVIVSPFSVYLLKTTQAIPYF